MGQILFYDERGMRVYDCILFDVKPPDETELDATSLEDMETQIVIRKGTTSTASITIGEVKAELDPTTMKRIAQYNLHKDFEELNRKISNAVEKLSQLDKEMNTRREKILLIENLAEKIWKDDDFDEDRYLPDEDDDYDGDYEE